MGRPSTAGRVVKVDVKVNLNSNIKYMLNYLTENCYPQVLLPLTQLLLSP